MKTEDSTPTTQRSRPARSLTRQVIDMIEQGIRMGRWSPGARIASERDLSRETGASRSTIRSAIGQLAAQGRLEVRAARGAFVTAQRAHQWADPPFWPGLLNDPAISQADVLEFRQMLETTTARLAATRADAAGIATLTHIVAGMATSLAAGDGAACAELDAQFHQTVAEIAGNAMFARLQHGVARTLGRHIALGHHHISHADPAAGQQLLTQHRHILSAIISGQPARADLAMQQHLDYVRHRLFEQAEDRHEAGF